MPQRYQAQRSEADCNRWYVIDTTTGLSVAGPAEPKVIQERCRVMNEAEKRRKAQRGRQ